MFEAVHPALPEMSPSSRPLQPHCRSRMDMPPKLNVELSRRLQVLFVTAEAYPLAKTGGLADVSHALPIALARCGVDVRVLLPGYPQACSLIDRPRIVAKLDPLLGVSDATLISGKLPGANVPLWLVDSPSLFRRQGGLYQDDNGRAWPDNALRFAFFAHVGAELALGRNGIACQPDIVHANDWHTGLLPLILSQTKAPRPSTIFTVHNMAFQGNFPGDVISSIGIPECYMNPDGIEFFGQVSFLKAGLRYSDRVTTVSPTYANEVLTPAFGAGMDGVLRDRGDDLAGILNGIDDTLWDPAVDQHLPENYWLGNLSGKRTCKQTLQHEFGLPVNHNAPLIGCVSRLTRQKMADTIVDALPWIVAQGAQVVIVGNGDRDIEVTLRQAQSRYAGQLSVVIGYDERLAHLLQAGSDILLAPARFEPCGLTQLYAMRYGTLPIVRRTGGLADTVVNADAHAIANRSATGFVFDETSAPGLILAVARALMLFREPLAWHRLQMQAMAQDNSWDTSAARYVSLYCDARRLNPLSSAKVTPLTAAAKANLQPNFGKSEEERHVARKTHQTIW
ncbi:MAG: glycogen synthase GlgA [Alphaproteobacteria bacterium]|nr:glycogen synthase GlgA [Alphaproteobacteria bacterium]